MMRSRLILPALLPMLAVSFMPGCAARRAAKKAAADAKAAEKSLEPQLPAPGVDVTEASLRGTEFADVPQLAPIHFDYDSFSLKENALDALKKNAEYLKERKDLDVLVAGHCDDRGTIEYNLALGQKRAKEVREYYIRLGVPGKSVATISYGEEKPACGEQTDDCWAQNRRAETRVRARLAGSAPKPDTQ